MREVIQDFYCGESLTVMTVTIKHNGFCGGDRGHGGFVTVTLEPDPLLWYEVDGQQNTAISFTLRGNWERILLVEALSAVVKELEENQERC